MHGALLAIESLLNTEHAVETIAPYLQELVLFVFPLKDHRERAVRRGFLRLLPALHTSHASDKVADVHGTVRYLIELLRKGEDRGPSSALSTRRYPFVWRKGVLNGYSSTRVSLWDSLMLGRLAMGFAHVRAGTRVLILAASQAA